MSLFDPFEQTSYKPSEEGHCKECGLPSAACECWRNSDVSEVTRSKLRELAKDFQIDIKETPYDDVLDDAESEMISYGWCNCRVCGRNFSVCTCDFGELAEAEAEWEASLPVEDVSAEDREIARKEVEEVRHRKGFMSFDEFQSQFVPTFEELENHTPTPEELKWMAKSIRGKLHLENSSITEEMEDEMVSHLESGKFIKELLELRKEQMPPESWERTMSLYQEARPSPEEIKEWTLKSDSSFDQYLTTPLKDTPFAGLNIPSAEEFVKMSSKEAYDYMGVENHPLGVQLREREERKLKALKEESQKKIDPKSNEKKSLSALADDVFGTSSSDWSSLTSPPKSYRSLDEETLDPELDDIDKMLEEDEAEFQSILQDEHIDSGLVSSSGLEAAGILMKPDDELDELDLEFKRAVLGGLSRQDVSGTTGPLPSTTPTYLKDVEPLDSFLPAVSKRIERRVDFKGRSTAKGKRKQSVAQVFLWPAEKKGLHRIIVNKRDYIDHVGGNLRERLWFCAPFLATGTMGLYNVKAKVKGGGTMSQIEAVRVAIAKALQLQDPNLRPPLRKAKMMTRDPRVKEPKKPGRKKARKKKQWNRR